MSQTMIMNGLESIMRNTMNFTRNGSYLWKVKKKKPKHLNNPIPYTIMKKQNKQPKQREVASIKTEFFLTCMKCGKEIIGSSSSQVLYNFNLHYDKHLKEEEKNNDNPAG